MRVLIVEDETAAYENMVDMLAEINPEINVIGNTESIKQTIKWLETNPLPDLILMDIHLSDGSAFSIFDHVKIETPIIFTTAYDEYAIEAFRVNSIDYILKPIKIEDLERALNKFSKLTQGDLFQYIAQLTNLADNKSYIDKLLIPIHDKLFPLDLKEVSFIYSTDRNITICTKDGHEYPYAKPLDHIMKSLDPSDFIRANKQFIVAKSSVKNITIWFDNRLLVTMDVEPPERIYISKNNASEFKNWIVSK